MTLFGGNRTVAVGLTLNPRGLVTGLAVASKSVKDFASSADKSLEKHQRNWDGIADAAGKAGLVIGAGAAAAVVAFAKFDKSMSRAAAGTQATAAELAKLREAAIQAGQSTQYSATEAADAITEMGKAGVSTTDILDGGLAGTLSLAAAGELEVADAAGIAATALTQFGLAGTDLPHVADLLAAGAGKAQGSVQDLGYALKYVGPVAKSAHISIEETVGVIAELASQGIIGEQAGTSFRGMLQALRGPSVKATATMKELGIELYGANGQFVGMAQVAEQLKTKLAPLSEAQQDAALATLFGNETVTAATVLMNGGAAAVEKWTAAVNDQGYAAKQAGQLMDNLAGDFEQLKGSLETALISSGSGANSGLRTLTQAVTGAVNAFSSLPDGVQRSAVVIAGVTAAVGLATAGLIKGAIAVKTMQTNLDQLGVAGTRVKGVMAGVGKAAGAVGVAYLIIESSGGVAKALGAVGDDLAGMQLELANYARGADLAGESAKQFGANLQGQTSWTKIGAQDLKTVINDLSGINGWWRKDVPLVGSNQADQIRELGKALAGLAQAGQQGTAAAAFDRLTRSAGLNAEETKRLLKLMPEYDGYLSQVAATQVSTGEATAGTADAMSVLKGSMDAGGESAKDLEERLEATRKAASDLNDVFLSARSATRAYEQALDDASELLGKPGDAAKKVAAAEAKLRTAKTDTQRESARKALADAKKAAAEAATSLDVTTEAGRRSQAALDDVASAAQEKATALLAAGGTEEQYRATLEESRKKLQALAQQFGMTKGAAQAYVDEVLRIPDKVTTDVELTGIEAVMAKLGILDQKVVTINNRKATVQVSAASGNVREDRGGAVIPAPRAPARGKAIPRAGGGPVVAGQDYLVGERRPEIFRPDAPGYIIPSVAAAAARPAAPQVVTVPVRESSTTNNPVNLNGPITVVAPTPSRFTDWASSTGRFGLGGQG